MSTNGLKVTWPDADDRRKVLLRRTRHLIGYVRSVGDPHTSEARYFAEDADGLPIEGTFKTRCAAADACLRAAGGWDAVMTARSGR